MHMLNKLLNKFIYLMNGMQALILFEHTQEQTISCKLLLS